MINCLKGFVWVNVFCYWIKLFEYYKLVGIVLFENMWNLMIFIFCMSKECSLIYLGWVLIMVKVIIDFKKLVIVFFGIFFFY